MLILLLQMIRIDIVYTNWGWNRSHFAQHYFWPLLFFAFVLSSGAPFFSSRSIRQCFLFSLLATFSAAFIYFGSSYVIVRLYGS